MLVGKSARGGTSTAAASVGAFSKILGVSVSTKMAGNTIKAIYTKNTKGTVDKVSYLCKGLRIRIFYLFHKVCHKV
jgi:hypothetical protein